MDDGFSKLILKMHIRTLGIRLYDRVPPGPHRPSGASNYLRFSP